MICESVDIKEFFPSLQIIIKRDKYPKLFDFLFNLKHLSFSFFDCNFIDNICVKKRLYGCCATCMVSYGYYKYDSFLLEDPEIIVSNFSFKRNSIKYGFLNLEYGIEGCSIPRHIRSNPCNIHKCFKPDDKNKQQKIYKYDELVSNINKYFLNPYNLEKSESQILIDLISENENSINILNISID